MAVSMVGMAYVAYVQYFGAVKAQEGTACPIDHSSRQEMIQIAKKKKGLAGSDDDGENDWCESYYI